MEVDSDDGQGEPPMLIQRPSSTKSQDVSHILATVFRQLFARDHISSEKILNLQKSRGGKDQYHEQYVERLKQIEEERDRRMTESAMLERHIMQAQARAMSADEREFIRQQAQKTTFPDIGLPPVRSHYGSVIDHELLKRHNLITPSDFWARPESGEIRPPMPPENPYYAKETIASKVKKNIALEGFYRRQPKKKISDIILSEDDEADHEDRESSEIIEKANASWKVEKRHGKQAWHNQISAEEREDAKKGLLVRQRQANYLKNPKYVFPAPTLVNREQSDSSVTFQASPEVVLFNDYSVGQTYEMTLDLRNVTTVLRQVRVLPPKTGMFSVSLGQFPSDQSGVAPGMSCRYIIRFAPDSLADFEDELIIEMQTSSPLRVPLKAYREPPSLTLPRVLDVGECLVGGLKVVQFEVKNYGGHGRFAVIKREAWPTSNFKSATSSGLVSSPPFEIRPSIFELRRGQTCLLEILFMPQNTDECQTGLVLVCDNCHVQYVSIAGRGQLAGVDLISVEDGLSEPLPDELCDLTAHYLLKFANLNPFTYLQRTVTVQNPCKVDIPYSWIVVKPYIWTDVLDPDIEESVSVPTERIQDVDSAFSVEPDNGILKAGKNTEFAVTFAPPEINTYHSVLHLVIKGIPKIEKIPDDKPLELQNGPMKIKEPITEDVTAMELECKGECEPLSVMLQPYAVHIPGYMSMDTPIKRQFKMVNNSITAILFQWEKVTTERMILEVEPPLGELMPQTDMEFDLTILGMTPGNIEHTLLCTVQHLDTPLTLHIEAKVKGCQLVIEQSNLNYGLVRLGETVETYMVLRNDERVPAEWAIIQAARGHPMTEEFSFDPEHGILNPLQTMTVKVTFKPKCCQSLQTILELMVMDGNCHAIAVIAEVQEPAVCLLNTSLDFGTSYQGIPVTGTIQLYNQTRLPTKFSWQQPLVKKEVCAVTVEPVTGELEARQTLTCTVTLTSNCTGSLSNICIPCVIDGMEEPLCMAFNAQILGLSVQYGILNEQNVVVSEGANISLDYGKVLLGQTRFKYLTIKNLSAIKTKYQVTIDYFNIEQEDKYPGLLGQPQFPVHIESLNDPLDKTPKQKQAELCKSMLKDKKGLAFSVQPETGELKAYGKVEIKITLYNDVWGNYNDTLTCKVGDLHPLLIPVTAYVRGCPAFFQMVCTKPDKMPLIRFGAHVIGSSSISRQTKITNNAPYDIRLDWEVVQEHMSRSYPLDLVVSYGPALPLQNNAVSAKTSCHSQPARPTSSSTESSPGSNAVTPAPSTLKRPKIITLCIKPHFGRQAKCPFTVQPPQMFLPAKKSANITVTFDQQLIDDFTEEQKFRAVALGYFSLEDQLSSVDGHVTRESGYEVPGLSLFLRAETKNATVIIETIEEDGMIYTAAASDIMKDGKAIGTTFKLCRALLSNPTKTELHFKLVTCDPFYIVSPGTTKPRVHVQKSNMVKLAPKQNLLATIGFAVNSKIFKHLDACESSKCDAKVQLRIHKGHRRLYFKENLLVKFKNKSEQVLPLEACVMLPEFSLSHRVVNFGTCYVGQTRHQQVELKNTTPSDSYWVTSTDVDGNEELIVAVQPTSGKLEAQTSFRSKSSCLVNIYFTAKNVAEYKVNITFHGLLREQSHDLSITGRGSYDEFHLALVNI